MKDSQTISYKTTALLKFLIPSIIGIFLFMIPISYQGSTTIPVALLASFVQNLLSDILPQIMTVLMIITVIGSILYKLKKATILNQSQFLNTLFNINPFWFITRLIGMVFAILTLFKIGPKAIWSSDTGGLLLNDLLPVLFSVFLFAGLFLPLLLDFGLLELCGALFTKIMRPLFKLPGRSSIDCLASWLGDGTIGVLLTAKQYEDGFYTKKEAAIIGTTFSVVSITFTIVILSYLHLEDYFKSYYFTVVLAGLVAAFIMPRIPPLSMKADTYIAKQEKALINESIPSGISPFRWGLFKATEKADDKNNHFSNVLIGGVQNILDMWLAVVPVVMAIGTMALIIANYTPVFKILGYPFVPILSIMQVPEATEAAQTMVVGFADMFLPAVIGSSIESDLTRFVIACTSVTQLIYMSEVGGLLLGSKIPVSFFDLIIIFILRTLITLPIIVIMAHILF
ncbi:YjiH family protein [Fredinandcohnia quinoae]|uniref:YjiH family protein n=1 Tax=Fredinandcohnia quinoae TaxID=2918902 RepID=A0AAW5E091_9BACI|nr:YjiH family protein [Fredinandcohnia sp. SECRCQ15]MCH1626327.1 YjiH family protein [Fredinandcohnia sp. SECRCQ15]